MKQSKEQSLNFTDVISDAKGKGKIENEVSYHKLASLGISSHHSSVNIILDKDITQVPN